MYECYNKIEWRFKKVSHNFVLCVIIHVSRWSHAEHIIITIVIIIINPVSEKHTHIYIICSYHCFSAWILFRWANEQSPVCCSDNKMSQVTADIFCRKPDQDPVQDLCLTWTQSCEGLNRTRTQFHKAEVTTC